MNRLILSLLLFVCALSPAHSARQSATKDALKIEATYSKETNVTRVMLHGVKIPANKDNFSLGAAFFYEGQTLSAPPCCVTLYMNSFSAKDAKYEKNHNLSLWADGKLLRSGPINYDWNLLGGWQQETMWIEIPRENFSKLANSKKAEVRIGSFKFRLTPEQSEGLRRLEGRMTPPPVEPHR
jgi:hypothetical protein